MHHNSHVKRIADGAQWFNISAFESLHGMFYHTSETTCYGDIVGATTDQKCFKCSGNSPQYDRDMDPSMWSNYWHTEACNYGPGSIQTCGQGEVSQIKMILVLLNVDLRCIVM